MAQEFAKPFYSSKAWLSCRRSFIDRRRTIDGGMCQRCKEKLGYIVHHKVLLTPENITDADISLNINNLEYLCKDCHDTEHDAKFTRKRIKFDENGDVLPADSPYSRRF